MPSTSLVGDREQLAPSDPYLREQQTFPELTDDQIERACQFGIIENLAKGTALFERGDRTVDFFIALKGVIEIYEHRRDGLNIITVHGEHNFTGEVDLFNDRQILVGGRMGEDGTVIRIDRPNFQKLIVAEPDIGEIVMRAFILRRVGLITHKQGSVTLLMREASADTVRIERFLSRNGYPIEVLDCNADDCEELIDTYGLQDEDMPVVLIHLGERVLSNPNNYELAEALGLAEHIDESELFDVTIVGAGPSGLSAAVYAASEGLKTLLLEHDAPGGQASTSSKIENYLGFPTGISGQALAGRAQIQAQKFGAKILLPHSAINIDCAQGTPFRIDLCSGKKIKSKAIVVASGATYRTLDLDNGRAFDNAGVYYAATSMESKLCLDEEVIVVGGGNSAGQAAVFMSGHASHVHILIRRDSLAATMSEYLIDRINSSPKITLHTHTEITGLDGDSRLQNVTWKNINNGDTQTHPIRHVFLMIGAVPNTEWLHNCVGLDEKGFIRTGLDVIGDEDWSSRRDPMMLETTVPGIFAVGDTRAGSIKRVASGVGEGSMSISQVHQFLAEQI